MFYVLLGTLLRRGFFILVKIKYYKIDNSRNFIYRNCYISYHSPQNIVTCITYYRRGLIWMIRFINTLYNQLVLTSNTALADLHNLQFTVTHALGFSVFTSFILVTESK
jgi:hypothetical protein